MLLLVLRELRRANSGRRVVLDQLQFLTGEDHHGREYLEDEQLRARRKNTFPAVLAGFRRSQVILELEHMNRHDLIQVHPFEEGEHMTVQPVYVVLVGAGGILVLSVLVPP